MTIWKFALDVTDVQVIVMPKVNRPLTVQMQAGIPCYWAVVDESTPAIQVTIRTFGTGHPGMSGEMLYLGTYQLKGGTLGE